jgi:predicted nuclease with TOPRIM domain
MEGAGSTWTDGRLDDFARRVYERFDRVDGRFRRVDERFNRVDERFNRVDERFDRVEARIDRLSDRIDELQLTMIRVGGGAIAAMLATLITVIATQG